MQLQSRPVAKLTDERQDLKIGSGLTLNRSSPILAIAVCGMVTVLSLGSIKDIYERREIRAGSGDPYGVLLQQARLQGVVSSLPAIRVVGYLQDPGVDFFTGAKKQLGAQMAFAPRMLVRQSRFAQQWVVGDFSRPIDLPSFAQSNGLQVVRNFGGGIVLFQRIGAR